MIFHLSMQWIIPLNVFWIASVQMLCAYGFTRMPESWFATTLPSCPPPCSTSSFLRKWKHLLPDGAAWFAGGFRKGALESSDPEYLLRFITETRRGESCHWTAATFCLVPLLWNPWWGALVIGGWAIAGNLPCILLQRSNRLRLARAVHRIQRKNSVAKSARS